MRRILIPLLIVAVLFGCRREELTPPSTTDQGEILQERSDPSPVPEGDPLEREALDQKLIGLLQERDDFQWAWVDLHTLWSALQYNDHSLSIGYRPANVGDIDAIIHTIDIRSGAWRAVHDALLERILAEVNRDRKVAPLTLTDILVEDDPVLPIITIRTTDKRVLTMLHNLQNVRYVEPLDYWPEAWTDAAERSTSGCSQSTTALNSADVSTITPNARLPWNFGLHNIPFAWEQATGAGLTVGVIDAGLSTSQSLLGSGFNNGASNVGRTVTASATLGSTAYNSCSHGTSMAAQAVGPRNNMGGTTGVAYHSGLRFIRASEDVVLDKSSERTAVKNALVAMGNDQSVRVVSMSIGTPFSYGVLNDGVNYAHGNGKLLMAAAGTSFGWTSWWGVIYPARYAKCVAVTGVKENGARCSSCHDGSQVMYTVVMERNASSSRNSVTLPVSGSAPTYIGGSSSATATAAGIAALVWSADPARSREQVLQCMTSTAQFANGASSSKGFGNLNAAAAVACALGQSN